MISPSSFNDRTGPQLRKTLYPTAPVHRLLPWDDVIPVSRVESLQHAFQQRGAIRPEVVARARQLARDPSYPSRAIIQQVAEQILAGSCAGEKF